MADSRQSSFIFWAMNIGNSHSLWISFSAFSIDFWNISCCHPFAENQRLGWSPEKLRKRILKNIRGILVHFSFVPVPVLYTFFFAFTVRFVYYLCSTEELISGYIFPVNAKWFHLVLMMIDWSREKKIVTQMHNSSSVIFSAYCLYCFQSFCGFEVFEACSRSPVLMIHIGFCLVFIVEEG